MTAVQVPDAPVLTQRNWFLLGVLATLRKRKVAPTYTAIRDVTGWPNGTITAQLGQLVVAKRIRVVSGKPQAIEIITDEEGRA